MPVISQLEENALIDRILAGKQDGYARLVDTYKSYAFTIAFKILNNRPDAEEAAQDAFVKAYRSLKSFNRQSKFSTWLYRIVFNTAISYKRKNRVAIQSIDENIDHSADSLETDVERDDKRIFIGKALEQLNALDRTAIQLYYLKEFTLEEVAGIMGHNLNTLKVRVHRARHRLAEELRKILKQEALTL